MLAAVVEIDTNNNYILIRSLVVHPDFFRQGIAGKLIKFVFETFKSNLFVVETGLENGPATKLYEKFGFVEVHQWDTNHGIRKIKFEKRTRISFNGLPFLLLNEVFKINNSTGKPYCLHLIPQPTLGFWFSKTSLFSSKLSITFRISCPDTGFPFPGLAASNCP